MPFGNHNAVAVIIAERDRAGCAGGKHSGCAPDRSQRSAHQIAQLGIVVPDYQIPNGFIPLTNGTINYAGVSQATYSSLPTDGVTALSISGMTVQNLATNYADASASVSAAVANYEGLWWNAPANSEPGWGINLAHHGDTIFATWFTYDATGKGWWLVMTAPRTAPNTYAGTLYRMRNRRGDVIGLKIIDGTCYSADTEVLTQRGWLRFADTDIASDHFATRNQKTASRG